MLFRCLAVFLALVLMPTSLLAGPRAPFHPAAGQPVATAPGQAAATAAAGVSKRCMRGALPWLSCSADIGLPVTIVLATAAGAADGFEPFSPAKAGISPGCLLGPPRSC